jgi:hypothetical protein
MNAADLLRWRYFLFIRMAEYMFYTDIQFSAGERQRVVSDSEFREWLFDFFSEKHKISIS